MTDVRVSEVENVIMAGNRVTSLPPETIAKLKYVKKLDLRMNQLSLPAAETSRFTAFEHLTHGIGVWHLVGQGLGDGLLEFARAIGVEQFDQVPGRPR